MRELKQRVNRIENKTGLKDDVRVIWLHTPLYCNKNREAGKIYNGCEEIIIGYAEKQDCKTCEYKNICSQKKPDRFKKLWEKHFKSKICNTCTDNKHKKQCGVLEI